MNKTWGVWNGLEVEGKYSGVPTLFLYAAPEQPLDWLRLFAQYPHIYFCSTWLAHVGTDLIDEALATAVVTLEVKPEQLDLLTPAQIAACHLMLFVPVPPGVQRLKYHDTVRLTFGLFLSRSYLGFVAAQPSHYQADHLIAYAADPALGQDRG